MTFRRISRRICRILSCGVLRSAVWTATGQSSPMSRKKIIVAVNTGEVTIEGANLELRHMHRDRLTVTGRIEALTFSGGGRPCGG